MSKTCVVIPNWNGLDLIESCLDGLGRQTADHSVIMVDNGSTDGSRELVAAKFPNVTCLPLPQNRGFAGGVNHGITFALTEGFDRIVLLNNDAVVDPGWLEALVTSSDNNPGAGIITSKMVRAADGSLDSTGEAYSTWGFPFPRGRDEVDAGQYDESRRVVFGASGGASLYRADMLRQIGLFDERFFAYFEDVDISFRAQLAGWQVRYEPKAVARHHIGGTSSRIATFDTETLAGASDVKPSSDRPSGFARFHTVKNFYYLYTKNMPGLLYFKYLPLFWASVAMMFVSDLRRGLVAENLRATVTAWSQFPSVLRDRWRIQKARTVTPGAIDAILYHGLPPLQMLRFKRFQSPEPQSKKER